MVADDFARFPRVERDDDLDDLVELDYGEGKTRLQEAEDSAAMIGFVLLLAIVFLLGAGAAGLLWWAL